jgi:hypothetical protein
MAQDFGQQRQKHRADMDEYSQLSARAAAIEADISIGRDRSHYISIRSLYLSIGSLYISIARDRSLAPLLRKQFITYYCIAQSPSANSEDAHTRMHARTHTFTHKRTHARARARALEHAYIPTHVVARSRVHVLSRSNKKPVRTIWRRSYNACLRESKC